jgi:sec-independent protein translocase protein TatA
MNIMTPTFAFLNLSPWEIIILLGIGVLLFGRKLPEMGKMLGKGLVEFKKGMSGMEDELMGSTNMPPRHEAAPMEAPRPPQRVTPAAPKFEDPTTSTNITTPPSA